MASNSDTAAGPFAATVPRNAPWLRAPMSETSPSASISSPEVLVNRKLDADGSDGMAIVKAIQADAALSSIPVILVSNYADAQSAAVAAGALPGFGKSDIGSEEAIAKLAAVLKAKS